MRSKILGPGYQLSMIADLVCGRGVGAASKKEALISADHTTPAKYSCMKKDMVVKVVKPERVPPEYKILPGKQDISIQAFKQLRIAAIS